MGKKYTIRHKVRRKLEQCANLCDNINQHLAECAAPYEQDKKEHYATFMEIGSIVETARKLLIEFRKVI